MRVNLLSGSIAAVSLCGLALILASASVASAQGPTVSIFTDKDSYVPGETIEVSLGGENTGPAVWVDVYVGLLTPGGSVFSLQPGGWAEGIGTWIEDIELPTGFEMLPMPLWWFEIPCDMPPIAEAGQYSFASVLTAAGTLDWLCEASFAPFDVEGAPVQHFYVNAELGDDANDGSEQLPWQTITHALDSVEGSAETPAEIHVAAGTYSPSTNGETFPLNMKSWTSLMGESPQATFLDAEANNSVIRCSDVSGLTIDGFTIANGQSYNGGGIDCSRSSLVISNNRIIGNSAQNAGGGIMCFNGSSPSIVCNTLTDNVALPFDPGLSESWGGAICIKDCSSPIVSNNTIDRNFSYWYGGGISFCSDSSPDIYDNRFAGNVTVFSGGGIFCEDNCFGAIEHNVFVEQWAGYGGAIFCGRNCSPGIRNNHMLGNRAGSSDTQGCGGGIYSGMGSPTISGNTIEANMSDWGSGIFHWEGSARISNNLIVGNTLLVSSGTDGGRQIDCASGSPIISNNTVVGISHNSHGVGISCWNSGLKVFDCILWNNGDDLDGCSASYSCIEDPDPGEGNIHEDPMFVTGPLGDYYLHPDSPCVDAGSRSAEEEGLADRTTQVDGRPDTGTVDMGYHYAIDQRWPVSR